MAQPVPYNRQFNFQNFQALQPTVPLPADKVDLEFNSAKITLDQILANLKLIQRDDGALANQSVGFDQLKPEVQIGFNPPSTWVAGVNYVVGDTVFDNGKFYRAKASHTSSLANRPTGASDATWELLADFTNILFVLPDGGVTTAKLDDGAVTEQKLATDAVTTNKLADNAVIAQKIAASAVTGSKIAANTITNDKIFTGTITGAKFAEGALPVFDHRAEFIAGYTGNNSTVSLHGYGSQGGHEPLLVTFSASEPSHPGKIQTDDDRWWVYTGVEVEAEMFGAVRDGATDDAPAINNAIAYVNSRGGGVVKLRPGSYRINNPIFLLDGVTLRGANRSTTISVPSAWQPQGSIVRAVSKVRVCVEGLTVAGNYLAALTDNDNHGIHFFNVIHGSIRDNSVTNTTGDGIQVNGAEGFPTQNVVVKRNFCFNNRSGISLFKNCIDCHVIENDVEDSRLNGIMADDATTADDPGNPDPLFHPARCFRVHVARNSVARASLNGSSAGIVFSGVLDGTIAFNVIRDCGVNTGVAGTSKTAIGIVVNSGQEWFNPSQNIVVMGNVVTSIVGGGGIQIFGAWTVTIVGNVFDTCFLWPDPLAGVLCNVFDDNVAGQHTFGVVIDGNTFVGNANTSAGIQFATTTDCHVGTNTIRAVTTSDILNNGPGVNFVNSVGVGALPAWTSHHVNRLWLNISDSKLYVGGAVAWIVVGTQT